MQGKKAPLHLEVEAAIVTNTSTLTTSRDFLTDAIRLARQVRTKLIAMPVPAATTTGPAMPVDGHLERMLRRRSLLLFAMIAAVIVAADLLLLRVVGDGRLVAAGLILGGALAVGGVYAWLVDRAQVRWAFFIGAGVLGAIAALDQLLSHFIR
jgi:hypothetical protein